MSGPGRSNAELLKQLQEKNPLDGLGCSYSPHPVQLWIQDMKNYYVDFYRHASKHVHFIHFKARSRLSNELVTQVEEDLRTLVLSATEQIDHAMVQAETLMTANGITLSVTETPNCSPPLCHTAEIISPLTNRYIQLIEKTDYLLRALDSLFQQEVITMEEYNMQRGLFKRFYYACRRFDAGLRARMDAQELGTNRRRPNRSNGAGATHRELRHAGNANSSAPIAQQLACSVGATAAESCDVLLLRSDDMSPTTAACLGITASTPGEL